MATPAQVANDMDAHAAYWAKRGHRTDRHIERACRDAARVIRAHLDGEPVDGRTWGGLHRRLLNLTSNASQRHYHVKGWPDFDRALAVLYELRREVRS